MSLRAAIRDRHRHAAATAAILALSPLPAAASSKWASSSSSAPDPTRTRTRIDPEARPCRSRQLLAVPRQDHRASWWSSTPSPFGPGARSLSVTRSATAPPRRATTPPPTPVGAGTHGREADCGPVRFDRIPNRRRESPQRVARQRGGQLPAPRIRAAGPGCHRLGHRLVGPEDVEQHASGATGPLHAGRRQHALHLPAARHRDDVQPPATSTSTS